MTLRRLVLRSTTALCLGAALMLVGVALSSALSQARAVAQTRLDGALDLAGWSWVTYRQQVLSSAANAARQPAVRHALSAAGSSSLTALAEAEEAILTAMGDTGLNALMVLPDGRLLTGYISETAASRLEFIEWARSSTSSIPRWRLTRAGDEPRLDLAVQVEAVQADGSYQTLGYIALRGVARNLLRLQTSLYTRRAVSLQLLAANHPVLPQNGMSHVARLRDQRELDAGLIATVEIRPDYLMFSETSFYFLLFGLLALAAAGGAATLSVRVRLLDRLQALTLAASNLAERRPDVVIPKDASTPEVANLQHAVVHLGTALHAADKRMGELAYRDSLTALPNRLMFTEQLEKGVALARRYRYRLALMFVDLDDFKRVNDALGHQAGDRLLVEVARRIESCIRTSDIMTATTVGSRDANIVGRLGGDEFLILLQRVERVEDVATVASRIIEAVGKPVRVGNDPVNVGASIGVTLFPDDGTDAQALVRNADVAMYHAKSRGKNNYQYFSERMTASAGEQFQLQIRLREAIENEGLQVYLQPVFDIHTGALVRAEALLRWKDAVLGHVPPGTFIPLAEGTGDIVRLTAWVVDQVCKRLDQWSGRIPEKFQISFNITSADIKRVDIAATIRDALIKYNVSSSRLVVEVTESGLLSGIENPEKVIQSLRQAGLDVALDDFGTGYSSLSYLKRFAVNEIKIDKSFVMNLTENSSDLPIVNAIISLARTLNLTVTAEGVESAEQLDLLRRLGCHKVQGFLFSPPITSERFINEIARDPGLHRWMEHWIKRRPSTPLPTEAHV